VVIKKTVELEGVSGIFVKRQVGRARTLHRAFGNRRTPPTLESQQLVGGGEEKGWGIGSSLLEIAFVPHCCLRPKPLKKLTRSLLARFKRNM